MKKFEEGIFSDLRNLKPGVDASLEEPKVSIFSSQGEAYRRFSVCVGGKRRDKWVVQAGPYMPFCYFFERRRTNLPLLLPPLLPARNNNYVYSGGLGYLL